MNDDAIETAVRNAGMAQIEKRLASGDTETILDTLKDIAATERSEHIWKDGVYQGCQVTYTNPLLPDLRHVFHPYMTLCMTGLSSIGEHLVHRGGGLYSEDATADYFRRHGFPVPPGAPED